MPAYNFPPALQAVVDAYDPSTGCYRKPEGGLDACHTEIETLEVWRGLMKCIKPKVIVETGVYYGLSTCFLASALSENGDPSARIYSIDPWVLPHLWNDSELSSYINYIPKPTQDAVADLAGLEIDVLLIDSIHTYDQSSW